MPPAKTLPYREVVRKLVTAGFMEVGQKGSHVKFAKEIDEGMLTVIVRRHREVAVGTLRSILRQAGLTNRLSDGAVHFAGDQVIALPGWQEGAGLAAHAVVQAIHARVMAGYATSRQRGG